MLERCQLEPLRPDQCQRQQPGTGTGSRPPPPTICTGMHPAQQIAPPAQTEGQSSSAPRAAALAFFFCPSSTPTACPACRISSPARAGRCAAVVPMTTPAHRSRSRSHRPPTCTTCQQQTSTGTSAAPDDHASSPPHPMTTHQRQHRHLHSAHSLPALQDLTAAAQPPAPPPRKNEPRQRRPPAAACIAAACRMIHPAAPRKTAILRRRRRGQILHLTG